MQMKKWKLMIFYSVEQAIFTGQILERQRDRLTAESKYRIKGKGIDENAIA